MGGRLLEVAQLSAILVVVWLGDGNGDWQDMKSLGMLFEWKNNLSIEEYYIKRLLDYNWVMRQKDVRTSIE
jgi:hypothetical protein